MRLINRKKCGLLTANLIFPIREIFLSLHRRGITASKDKHKPDNSPNFSSKKSNIIRQINEKYHDLADYGSKLHSTGSKRKSVVTRMYPVLPAVY